MHLHWHVVIKEAAYGNAYLRCRCGSRKIRHVVQNVPMDYRWLQTGKFGQEPPPPRGAGAGTSGAGQARARPLVRPSPGRAERW